MTDKPVTEGLGVPDAHLMSVRSVGDLAAVLRHLRRREARARGGPQLTYRDLAEMTGWSRTMIGNYLSGKTVPPTERAMTRLTARVRPARWPGWPAWRSPKATSSGPPGCSAAPKQWPRPAASG